MPEALNPRRAAGCAAVAALCLWTLCTNVSEFLPVRIKLTALPTPGIQGEAVIPLTAALSRIPDPRAVVVCRVRNWGPRSIDVEARIGGEVLRRLSIRPRESARLDVVWSKGSPPPRDGALRLIGTDATWSVDSAEVANLHGFSRGLLNFFVLPVGQPVATAPLVVAGPVAIGLLLLIVLHATAGGETHVARVPAVLSAPMGALFAAAALAPQMTPYRIVFSPRTYFLGLLLLTGPYTFGLAKRSLSRSSFLAMHRRVVVVLGGGILGVTFFGSAMWQGLAGFDGNYSGFLHITRDTARRAPFLTERPDLVRHLILYDEGYDGQFMYLMAFDPLLLRFREAPGRYRDVVDLPPYRYGRIGYSLLTAAAAGGKEERYPMTMMALVVAAHAAAGALIAALALQYDAPPSVCLFYAAIPGFMPSMLFALPESIAICGLLAGLWLVNARRWTAGALCFGASLLVRETGAIFIVAVLAARPPSRRMRCLAIALLPVVLWRAYTAFRFIGDFGARAILVSPGDFGIPFRGLADLVFAASSGRQPGPEFAAAFAFPLLIAGALALALAISVHRPGGPSYGYAAATYAVVAVCLNYEKIWTHVPSGERATTELFVCLLLVLLAFGRQPSLPRRALVVFFWCVVAYTFALSPEASSSRAALLLIR